MERIQRNNREGLFLNSCSSENYNPLALDHLRKTKFPLIKAELVSVMLLGVWRLIIGHRLSTDHPSSNTEQAAEHLALAWRHAL